jgi:hypothetical protein
MNSNSDPRQVEGDKPGWNLVAIVKDYIDNMLAELQGRKALILDKETLSKYLSDDTNHHNIRHRITSILKNSNITKGSILY